MEKLIFKNFKYILNIILLVLINLKNKFVLKRKFTLTVSPNPSCLGLIRFPAMPMQPHFFNAFSLIEVKLPFYLQ